MRLVFVGCVGWVERNSSRRSSGSCGTLLGPEKTPVWVGSLVVTPGLGRLTHPDASSVVGVWVGVVVVVVGQGVVVC